MDDRQPYYDGQVKWIVVSDIEIPDQLKTGPYASKAELYKNSFQGTELPPVPETLPFVQVNQRPDAKYPNAQRISITSYILKPKKWVIHAERSGGIIGGNDVPSSYKESEKGSEELTLTQTVDVDVDSGIHVGYGQLKLSAAMKSHTGVDWKRNVTVSYSSEKNFDGTKAYQAVIFRAKLSCDILNSGSTSLLGTPTSNGLCTTQEGHEIAPGDELKSITDGVPLTECSTASELFAKRPDNTPTASSWDFAKHKSLYVDYRVLPRYEDASPLVWQWIHNVVETVEPTSPAPIPKIYNEDIFKSDSYVPPPSEPTSPVGPLDVDYNIGQDIVPWKVYVEIKGS